MVQVPYVPYPTAEPTTQGTPSLRIEAPSEAFGANVARAIQGFGEGLEHDSDKIWARAVALQELQNETAARNMDIQSSKQMGALSADFRTKLGMNAGPQALEQYTKSLNDIYQQNRAALPNDDARRRYDATAVSFLNRETFNGSLHSGNEVKNAAKGSAMAQIDTAADGVYTASVHGDGEVGLQTAIETARRAARSYSDLEGMTPEAAQSLEDKQVSKIVSHLIAGTAQNQPGKAAELLDKYGSMIHGDDQIRVQNTVESRTNAITSRVEVDKVLAPLWHLKDDEKMPTEKDMREQVEAMADRVRPDDPLFKRSALNYFESQFGRIKVQQRDVAFNSMQTVKDGIVGAFTNGRIPSIDEFRQIPEVAAAMAKLSPARQYDMENHLAKIIGQGDRVSPYASLQRRQYYMGMANSPDEADRQKFLSSTVIDDRGLSVADMKFLIGQQKQMRDKAQANVNVSHALQVLGPDLNAAGVTRGTTGSTDRENYYTFMGVLQDRLSQAQGTKGKALTDEEIKAIGRPMLAREAYKHWYGTSYSDPTFIREAPKEDEIDEWIRLDQLQNPGKPAMDRAVAARQLLGARLQALEKKPSAGAANE